MTVKSILLKCYTGFMRTRPVQYFRYKAYQDDRTYIENQYKKRFGVKPDLDDPKNFNEKNNWRKLYDRKPLYTELVDKILLKKHVAERCGEEHAIKLLYTWDSPKDIDFDALPDQFVLKPNHAGGVIICRDKKTFDRKKAVAELSRALKIDYFIPSREWPYKNVKRRILCETYMGEEISDYKSYCFNGKLYYTYVWKNVPRADGRKPAPFYCGGYDRDWKNIGMELGYPSMDDEIPKPACYDELVRVCEAMSKGIPFVRVDCFVINNKVYVGEMTFFPWAGYLKIKDPKWNDSLGELEQLPEEKTV